MVHTSSLYCAKGPSIIQRCLVRGPKGEPQADLRKRSRAPSSFAYTCCILLPILESPHGLHAITQYFLLIWDNTKLVPAE